MVVWAVNLMMVRINEHNIYASLMLKQTLLSFTNFTFMHFLFMVMVALNSNIPFRSIYFSVLLFFCFPLHSHLAFGIRIHKMLCTQMK